MNGNVQNPANVLLDVAAFTVHNHDYFLLEFGADHRKASEFIFRFQNAWKPLGAQRDPAGNSHTGVLPLQALAHRSLVYGFDALQSFRIPLAWPSMRYALETVLVIGKFIADPSTAKIWTNWKSDKRTYTETFLKGLDANNALPRCADFRKVLSGINDEYLHPNPLQVLSPANTVLGRKDEKTMRLATTWAGGERHHLDAHVLSFVRLFADLVDACDEMVCKVMALKQELPGLRIQYEEAESGRAKALVKAHPELKNVLQGLGLWPAKHL
jgi:hypothetical protein